MRYRNSIYPALTIYSAVLVAIGLIWDGLSRVMSGLYRIITMPDLLITDYMEIAGPGAAFVNAGLVSLISLFLLVITRTPSSGFSFVEIGLMSGFAFFGKNIVNILPIIAGGYLYSLFRKEPFSKYVSASMRATALAPAVTFFALHSTFACIPLGIAVGLLIGFIMPSLAAYTYKLQNGMNLYNMGFACGMVAILLVPLLISRGEDITTPLHWATIYNRPISILLSVFCLGLIAGGFFRKGKPAWAVWAGYRRLLHTSGRDPSDYFRMFGASVMLVNMGINGLIGIAYILLINGQFNGPTIGGILTIIGCSAFGKHARNILPIMTGVVLGGMVMEWSISDPALQIAGLFCTTLAPIAGYFGMPYGILAGFLHSSVVLTTGMTLEGMNLYNNGFSGGLVAIVLYPTIMAIARHRRPALEQHAEYLDMSEGSKPITLTPEYLMEKRQEELEKTH